MSVDSSKVKAELRRRLLDADFNARYHDALCRRYHAREHRTGIALASATIAVAFFATIWPTIPRWCQALSVLLTSISTLLLPRLKWAKLIPILEAERARWIQLKLDYENLWTDTHGTGEWDDAAKELRKLRRKDDEAEAGKALVPRHDDLLDLARQEVIEARTAPSAKC